MTSFISQVTLQPCATIAITAVCITAASTTYYNYYNH